MSVLTLSISFFLLLSVTTNFAAAQQGGAEKKNAPPLKPLGEVLMMVLDKDKNQKVTMEEVNEQMTMLEMLFKGGEEGSDYLELLQGVKAMAPTMFELLDSNGDKALTQKELKYVTKFEKSLKKGGEMKGIVRDSFGILDTNGDDELSVDELLAAIPTAGGSSDALSQIAAKIFEVFPLRSTAEELEAFVQTTIKSIGGDSWDKESVSAGMKWLDEDGDGSIRREEVGKAYNKAGKKFLEIAKTIKTMGPMLAMFSGGDMGGGMNMNFNPEF